MRPNTLTAAAVIMITAWLASRASAVIQAAGAAPVTRAVLTGTLIGMAVLAPAARALVQSAGRTPRI